MIMKREQRNYTLKIKYSIVETSKDGKAKLFHRKINKVIPATDKTNVFEKIHAFEEELSDKKQEPANILEKLKRSVQKYTYICRTTYDSMLRT